MKYLKTYETLNIGKPKVGDYVIYKDPIPNNDEIGILFDEFTANNIGKIYKQNPIENGEIYYLIQYNDIPKKLEIYFHSENFPLTHNLRDSNRDEIIYWSKNKKDLEPYIQANKYNL